MTRRTTTTFWMPASSRSRRRGKPARSGRSSAATRSCRRVPPPDVVRRVAATRQLTAGLAKPLAHPYAVRFCAEFLSVAYNVQRQCGLARSLSVAGL